MSCCFVQCSLMLPERNHLVKDHSDEESLINDEQHLINLEKDEKYRTYRCIISWSNFCKGLGQLKRWTCNACTSKACRKCLCCTSVSILALVSLIALTLFVVLPLLFKSSIGLQRSLIFHPITQPAFVYNLIPKSGDSYYNCKELYSNKRVEVNKLEHITLGIWNLTCYDIHGQRRAKNASKPSLIIFHNENGDRRTYEGGYRALRNYFNVITFDYRSYGDSSVADLNETGLVKDSISLYKWLLKKNDADIFVMGEQLGASVATHVVSKLREKDIYPTGVILIDPFTSLSDKIREWFWPLGKILWWMPWYKTMITEPLRKNDLAFDTNKYIMQVDGPIMIIKSYRSTLAYNVALAASNRNNTPEGMVYVHETWWSLRDDGGDDVNFLDFIDDCINYKKNKVNI